MSFDGPVQTNQVLYAGIAVAGASGHCPQVPREVDDFKQPGDLLPPEAEGRAAAAGRQHRGSLVQVSREDIVTRPIAHVAKADAEFGRGVTEGVAARRKPMAGAAR